MMFMAVALLKPSLARAQTADAKRTYATRVEATGRDDTIVDGAKVSRRLETRINARIDTRIARDRLLGANPTTAFSAARERLTRPVAPVQPMPPIGDPN